MIPLRWRIHFSCTKRAAVLDTSSSIPFFFSSLFWFKTISHVVYRLHLFFHKAGKTFVVFSTKKNSIKSITEEISFRVCGGEWVLFSDWWMETQQCWAGVDWEVGGVRSAVSQSKALWVVRKALFALPPLTCTSPIRPLEGSPNRFTSENEEDFRSSLRGSEDKNLQNSVFGVLLL